MTYKNTPIPEDKDPEDYTHNERRAEILKHIIDAGLSRRVNQTELAQRYEASQPQISRDFKRIKEEIRDTIGNDIQVDAYALYQSSIAKLLDQERPYLACKVMDDYLKFIYGIGIEKSPEKIDSECSDLRERLSEAAKKIDKEDFKEK